MSLSGGMDPPMKQPFLEINILIHLIVVTVFNRQFKWGTCLLKSNGGV